MSRLPDYCECSNPEKRVKWCRIYCGKPRYPDRLQYVSNRVRDALEVAFELDELRSMSDEHFNDIVSAMEDMPDE